MSARETAVVAHEAARTLGTLNNAQRSAALEQIALDLFAAASRVVAANDVDLVHLVYFFI